MSIIEKMMICCGLAIIFHTWFIMKMREWQRHAAIDNLLPPQGSIISGTKQEFLYFEDFLCQTMGDYAFLPLITMAYCHIVVDQQIWEFPIMVVIAISDGIGFALMCLAPNHKPDWGYPEVGKISKGGQIHCVYHGVNVAMVVTCLYHWLWTGNLRGLPMWLFIIGGIGYLITFAADCLTGKFAPLKLESEDTKA